MKQIFTLCKNHRREPGQQKLHYAILMSVIAMATAFTVAACYISPDNDSSGQDFDNEDTVARKLIVNDLNGYNNCYVVAFGFNYNYEYLYGAKEISKQLVFTGNKVKGNKVGLNVWRELYGGTLEDYTDSGKFYFFIYILNKPTFTKTEEFSIGDYLYKGKPKPKWLVALGKIEGYSLANGECEGSFIEILPSDFE